MVGLISTIYREYNLYNGVSNENVGAYIKELKITLKELETSYIFKKLTYSEGKVDDLRVILNDEIEKCEFYFEFSRRRKKEPHFNEWVFLKSKERIDNYYWNENNDCWQKTNGKLKATIEIDTSGKMTQLSLWIQNDSKKITFWERRAELEHKHLSNANSISMQISKYKEKAEAVFREHQYPLYCKEQRNIRLLEKLMHIKEVM